MKRALAICCCIGVVQTLGCSAGGTSGGDGGGPSADAGGGGCGAACQPPDGGGCLVSGQLCSSVAPDCCPGLDCIDGGCAPPLNPCPNGERLLPSGCGCDPTLGSQGSCNPGFVCDANLQCVLDAGTPIVLINQPVGAPCDPSQSPACAQPFGDAGPDAGDAGNPLGTVDCVADPSGVYLYVCAQACLTNADCPLAWQACNSPYAASGHCGDNPCTAIPPDPKAFFAACPDGGGLCLPFNALVIDAGIESYGLCLQSSDAGPNSVCTDPPTRDGPLCDPQQLCVLGRCRTPCNPTPSAGPADAGTCLASEVCWPLGLQPVIAGASYAAGGCVSACELDGGQCDAGVDAGFDGGFDAGPPDAGMDGGPDAGSDGGPDGGPADDGGVSDDGGDGG